MNTAPASREGRHPGLIAPGELQALNGRRDGPALWRLGGVLVLLAATGTLVVLASGFWRWPAMVLHGVVLVHLFSLQHECSHLTAFRSRWLNNAVAWFCGIMIILPPRFFQLEHRDHHRYTQRLGDDPELIPLPRSIGDYVLYLSALPYWYGQFTNLFFHVMGRISEAEARFIPRNQRNAVIREARVMLAIHGAVVASVLMGGWSAPVWLWWLPLLLGEPFMRFIRMSEHVGRPTVDDLTRNTRSCRVAWPLRFLCWNMNYHAEHHYAPSVPFHGLPVLHRRIGEHLPVARGYLGAHREILGQLLTHHPR